MGAQARESVLARYTWPAVAERTAQIIRSL